MTDASLSPSLHLLLVSPSSDSDSDCPRLPSELGDDIPSQMSGVNGGREPIGTCVDDKLEVMYCESSDMFASDVAPAKGVKQFTIGRDPIMGNDLIRIGMLSIEDIENVI
jgi:hypothetical protein